MIDLNAIPLNSSVSEIFGTKETFSVLLRPDNHIGFISTGISSGEVTTYLDKFVDMFKTRKTGDGSSQ
jgi:hypothetical protein